MVFLGSAVNHHVARWLQEKERERVEAEEGGAESVVQSQNTTDAKVAGTEGGGREWEGEDEKGTPSSQSNKLHV